jgi:threonine dehydratase
MPALADPQRVAARLLASGGRSELEQAARAVAGVVRTTPVLSLDALSATLGARVAVKAECLQRTGSFKLRGAVAKITALGDEARHGVVAASAGNHAQGVALAATAAGVPAQIFMPRHAPMAKVEAVRRLGGDVELHGETFDDALERALAAAEDGRTFVHPFDDPVVVAGQGTVGLELRQQVPDLSCVIVPVGGGGLAAGIGLALRQASRRVRLIGVQAAAFPNMAGALFPDRSAVPAAESERTLADGIAVRAPGRLSRQLLSSLLDDIVVVTDEEIGEAMAFLADEAKLISEGAGAVGMAALLAGRVQPPTDGQTVVVVSGGNVDRAELLRVVRRADALAGRRLALVTRVADRPGGLARLVNLLAELEVNVVDVQHLWDRRDLLLRESAIQLLIEVRNADHATTVVDALVARSYVVQILE